MSRVGLALALSALLATAAGAAGRVVFAQGSWAAIDRGASCEALGRSARIAERGKVQAIAGFSFSADRRHWGEFRTRLRRLPRPGTSVILRVGSQPFLLSSNGNLAWSSDARQDRAIAGALRNATSMTVEARDAAGGRMVDPYGLDGAATAIDAAAAACAGKMQPR